MKRALYLIFLLSAGIYSCKNSASKQSQLENTIKNLDLKKYSKTSLISDFDLLISSLKEAHTGLYWYQTEQQFDSIVDFQKRQIQDSLNGLEFYNLLAPIVSCTKEDHCDIYPSDEVSDFLDTHGTYLPLSVLSVNKKIYILNKPANDLNIKGLELKKINGQSISKIYTKLFNTFSSDGYITQSKYRWLDNIRLSTLYAHSIGQPNNFEIEVAKPNSETNIVYTLPAVDKKTLKEISKNVGLYSELEPAKIEFLPPHTAILTFNTFHDILYEEKGMDFKKFVAKSFLKIDSLTIKNLIIDIRENGGGTEGNEDYLFSYLNNKPYVKYKDVEISSFNYSFYHYTDYAEEEDYRELEEAIKKEHYLAADGRILRKKGIEQIAPPNPNAYVNNVYILTSGWTYSGGAEFSTLMKQHTNAIFIGEEVGGGFYGNTSGYGLELTLPRTNISVDIPLLKFSLDVDKGEFGRGVIPDYPVQPTFQDYLNGHDAVLALAKKLIAEQALPNRVHRSEP